jgi:hypothetical protein
LDDLLIVRKRGFFSAVTAFFLVNLHKTKAKQRLGKPAILPEARGPGKRNRAAYAHVGAHGHAGIC